MQCAQCEAMLADALDGTLAADRQERFDAHVAECGLCSQMLADSRRGAAWLEMLRTPRPEPPVTLLEQILAATSGAQGTITPGRAVSGGMEHAGFGSAILGRSPGMGGVSAMAPGFAPGAGAGYGNVVPFRARAAAAMRRSSLGQIALQPRYAMTAAMAFFSIALTMNLTGVHPLSLRASDLRPSSLKRNFTDADARVVRYYEGLRVVYELESRVHDFEGATGNDVPAGSQIAPVQSRPACRTISLCAARSGETRRTVLQPIAASLSARVPQPTPAPAGGKNSTLAAASSPSVAPARTSESTSRNPEKG